MKKEVLLVLGILEGRGLHPVEGHKIQIEAQLDNHKLSTEAFTLTNAPKFNTEITWEAEKQTIRRYKLNRIPIKIECVDVNEKKGRKSLGYIVLPLTSAVEGVEVDSRWHKLLGGSNRVYKTPPSILLRLHLEAMTYNQQNQINGKPMNSFKNAQHIMEDNKMSYLLEKNKFLQGREGLEIRCIQTNGNQKSSRSEGKPSNLPLISSPHLISTISNGACVEEGELLDDDDSENMEDEEMLDYDSEEEYSDDAANSGIIINAFSLANDQDHNPLIQSGSAENGQKSNNVLCNQGIDNVKTTEPTWKEVSKEHIRSEKIDFSSPGTSKSKSFEKDSEHELLLKARASTREHLQNLSQSLRAANLLKKTPASRTSFSNSSDIINASLEKRVLDTSSIFDDQVNQKTKSRRVDPSQNLPLPSIETPKEKSDRITSMLKSSLTHNKAKTSAAFFLSHSIQETEKSNSNESELSPPESSPPQKMVPHLNQEEGYFSFGDNEETFQEFFDFSVTIIYAKNLSKIIPQGFSHYPEAGFQFCYSLLGYPIYTDPFHELDNPEFLAEKASAVIRSPQHSISRYFAQHYFLPVHFLSGETCLGVCTIDISQLVEIGNTDEAKVEGVFEVVTVEGVSLNNGASDFKAVMGVCFEISKAKNKSVAASKCRKVFPSEDFSSLLEGRRESRSYNEIVVSDSMSSSSESEETTTVSKRKMKSRRIKCRSNSKSHLTKHQEWLQNISAEREVHIQKRELLHEAAYEVEIWKEEQQRHFLREWTEKEETLQRLLASEWSSKAKLIEGELNHRLSECDQLQEKLNKALGELSLRERKLKIREEKATQLEQEMNLEKEKLHSSDKGKDKIDKGSTSSSQPYLSKQLEIEKRKRNNLEKEISTLREDLLSVEETVKTQNQEVIGLRRKLIQSDDIIGISKDKEAQERKIESLQERKQYYKSQWLNAITDLHKLHSAHKKTIDEMTADHPWSNEERSPIPEFLSVGYKLRKLKDERKILMESGLYPHDHSVIKNIDKKIRELVG